MLFSSDLTGRNSYRPWKFNPPAKIFRARQSHERKASTVRTSTDRLHQRCDTGFLHGVERQVHDELLRFDHFTHIVILVAQFERRTARMHLVHSLHQLVQQLFLPFESSAHMVAYDIGKRSLLDRSAYAGQMEKAFITGRMFGTLRDRQPRGELYRQQRCVQHLVLGISRMYVQPFENDFGSGSIEVLVFQLADLSAVDRIGPFATELFDIEVVGSGSDLFCRA